MKHLIYLLSLLAFCLASCSSEEPIGRFHPMKWNTPRELAKVNGNDFLVPDSGGTYTFTCTNYNWLSLHYVVAGDTAYMPSGKMFTIRDAAGDSIGVDFITYETADWNHMSGAWFDFTVSQADMVCTFAQLPDSVASRTLQVGVIAGNPFSSFNFKQSRQ